MENGDLQEKIRSARTLPHQAHGQYAVDFPSIPELLRTRSVEHPDRGFLVYYGDDQRKRLAYNYGEFARAAFRLAEVFASRFRLAPGDRVATLMMNHPLTVISYFAAWSIGAVVVPINVEESEERVRFILENSGAKLLLAMDEVGTKVRTTAGDLPVLFAEGGAPSLREIVGGSGPEFRGSDAGPDADALIVYTSGTTGVPKGVLLSQYNLLADARAISEWHGISEGDCMMCVLPIHHVNGTVVTLVTPCFAGASVVLNRRFSATSFWKIAAEEQVGVVSVVPTLLHFLYERNDDLSRHDLGKFRHFICGAGPLTVELAAKFEDRFGLRIVHGYGLSETTCYSCFLPVDLGDAEHRAWIRNHGFPSIGVPVPPNAMEIHDSNGKALPDGDRGEIVIRGHNVMKGYYRNPDANRSAFTHGWFRSGDEGFLLRDGKGRPFFFITGRIKELIARGGVKFSPLEIDEVLNAISGVRRGVAVGFENDAYGEEVGAYVELESSGRVGEEEILEACRGKLPFAKCPKVILFGNEVPLTSTGKIQRGKLKPLFVAYKQQQFRES